MKMFFASAALAMAGLSISSVAAQLEINGELPQQPAQQVSVPYQVVACPQEPGKPLIFDLTVCREFTLSDSTKRVVRGETIDPAKVRADRIESDRMVTVARANSAALRKMREAAEAQRLRAGGQPSRTGN